MQRILGIALLLGALALTGTFAGCRGRPEQTATPPPGAPGPAVTAAPLGTQQSAGPYQVTLSTAAPPKVGDTRFQSKVTRDGQPVTNATVSVKLSMPSMQMKGPEVTLEPAGEPYEGTANLSMAGDWQAEVTVSAGGETGTATYQFGASQ